MCRRCTIDGGADRRRGEQRRREETDDQADPSELLGPGAHRDPRQMAVSLKRGLNDALRQVLDLKPAALLQRRYERLQSYGRFNDTKER